MASSIVTMNVKPPFSFDEIAGYLSRSRNECLFTVEHNTVFRAVPVGENFVPVAIQGSDKSVTIQYLRECNNEHQKAVSDYVAEWLGLYDDLTAFNERMASCPLMKEVVSQHRGLRLVGVPNLFEALAWAIIGQQITLTFAYTLKRRFVEKWGTPHSLQGRDFWLFPQPEVVASLTSESLVSQGFSRNKASYVIDVAERIATNSLSKERLMKLGDFREIERQLLQIRGIGSWSAHYVLMRCFRDPSAFPVQDVGLHKAIKALMGLERKPGIGELQVLAECWQGYEAYAVFYLWRTLY